MYPVIYGSLRVYDVYTYMFGIFSMYPRTLEQATTTAGTTVRIVEFTAHANKLLSKHLEPRQNGRGIIAGTTHTAVRDTRHLRDST